MTLLRGYCSSQTFNAKHVALRLQIQYSADELSFNEALLGKLKQVLDLRDLRVEDNTHSAPLMLNFVFVQFRFSSQ